MSEVKDVSDGDSVKASTSMVNSSESSSASHLSLDSTELVSYCLYFKWMCIPYYCFHRGRLK